MNDFGSELAKNTLEQIPHPGKNAMSITGLVKEKGTVSGYQLSDGQIVSKQDGVNLAKQGQIKGVGVATRKGAEYLKAIPDDKENNNLSSLPTVDN